MKLRLWFFGSSARFKSCELVEVDVRVWSCVYVVFQLNQEQSLENLMGEMR